MMTRSCLECAGTLAFETRTDHLKYRELEISMPVLAWWCDTCGGGFLDGAALMASDAALAALKELHEKLSTLRTSEKE